MAELRDLVKYVISNLGYPVGMGIEPDDSTADLIIRVVRGYDAEKKMAGPQEPNEPV